MAKEARTTPIQRTAKSQAPRKVQDQAVPGPISAGVTAAAVISVSAGVASAGAASVGAAPAGAAASDGAASRGSSAGAGASGGPTAIGAAAVGRALDLLEALARVGPAPLATVAEAAGCTRTIGSGLLRTLQDRGFAMQDEARGLWRLGARWSVLGRAAAEQGALAATAMPFLVELGKATGENVYLCVRDAMESETIAIYQTDPTLRLYSEVGQRRALHAGSARMLLAHAPEAVQTQVLAQRLPRFTPATRTDPAWIAADLHRIRMRGYLVTSDEVVAGAVSVTAPVRDTSGQVIAVLFLSAPSMRMRPPRPRALVAQVFDAADRLSQVLGAPPAVAPAMPATAKQSQPAWSKATVGQAGAGLRGSPSPTRPSAATAPHSMLR